MDKNLIASNRKAYFRDLRAIVIVVTIIIAIGIAGTVIGNRGALLLAVLVIGLLMVYMYYYKQIGAWIRSRFELSKCVEGEQVAIASVEEDKIQGQYMKGEGQLGYHKFLITGENGEEYRIALSHTGDPNTAIEDILLPGDVYDVWYLPRTRVVVGMRPHVEEKPTPMQQRAQRKLAEELGSVALPLKD